MRRAPSDPGYQQALKTTLLTQLFSLTQASARLEGRTPCGPPPKVLVLKVLAEMLPRAGSGNLWKLTSRQTRSHAGASPSVPTSDLFHLPFPRGMAFRCITAFRNASHWRQHRTLERLSTTPPSRAPQCLGAEGTASGGQAAAGSPLGSRFPTLCLSQGCCRSPAAASPPGLPLVPLPREDAFLACQSNAGRFVGCARVGALTSRGNLDTGQMDGFRRAW